MKEEKGLNATGAYAILMILGVIVMIFTASRTLHFLQQTLPPSMQYVAYLGLACFDLGMAVWLWYAVTSARGVGQRVVAYGMVFVCLFGVAATTVVDIFIVSSQNGVGNQVPAQFSTIGLWIVCAVICANVLALVLVHFADPSHRKHMVMEKARDHIHRAVFTAIEQEAQSVSPQIATAAAAHWRNQVIAEMIGFIPDTTSTSKRLPAGKVVEALPASKKGSKKKLPSSSKNLKSTATLSSKNLKREDDIEEEELVEEDDIEEEELVEEDDIEEEELVEEDDIEEEELVEEDDAEPSLMDAANIVKKKVLKALPRRKKQLQ